MQLDSIFVGLLSVLKTLVSGKEMTNNFCNANEALQRIFGGQVVQALKQSYKKTSFYQKPVFIQHSISADCSFKSNLKPALFAAAFIVET